jgi:hypothetical protein
LAADSRPPAATRSGDTTAGRSDAGNVDEADGGAAGNGGAGDTGTLLPPARYDQVIGGVPPSPFVSAFLLGGLAALIAAVIGSSAGNDMTQWWILGTMLVVIATFLAGFVSRGA